MSKNDKKLNVELTNDNLKELNSNLRKIRIQKESRLALKKSYSKKVDSYGKECYLYIYKARENELIEDVFFDRVTEDNGGYIIELGFFGKGCAYNLSDYINQKEYTRIVGGTKDENVIATSDTLILEIGGRTEKSVVKGYFEVVVFGKDDNDIVY